MTIVKPDADLFKAHKEEHGTYAAKRMALHTALLWKLADARHDNDHEALCDILETLIAERFGYE